ncbi:hypothetical protein TYRP_019281, partial [Tyrophagus putrescentiae]
KYPFLNYNPNTNCQPVTFSHPGHCLISERRGPEFLVEPQSSIVFLNDTGAIVTCSAKGTPAPSITWTKVDGTSLSSVAGLRQIRKDLLTSQLVYLPFSAANYRQDVHSGTIRCVAANAAGAIQSQDVHIRASKCHLPAFSRFHFFALFPFSFPFSLIPKHIETDTHFLITEA